MKEILIYFEGPSDVAVMEKLFGSLLTEKAAAGVTIKFLAVNSGDRKQTLVTEIPVKAARILPRMHRTTVAIVPDLYPPNKGFRHSTYHEMRQGAQDLFVTECERIESGSSGRFLERFKVFCFKHDLESLLLACPEALKRRLDAKSLAVDWSTPVEDQNHDNPPKKVVQRLFAQHDAYYDDVTDAPLILEGCDPDRLAQACPQGFKPIVDFLKSL